MCLDPRHRRAWGRKPRCVAGGSSLLLPHPASSDFRNGPRATYQCRRNRCIPSRRFLRFVGSQPNKERTIKEKHGNVLGCGSLCVRGSCLHDLREDLVGGPSCPAVRSEGSPTPRTLPGESSPASLGGVRVNCGDDPQCRSVCPFQVRRPCAGRGMIPE
jgi:hypothetical protein